ncbi:hypothetical protein, partial [Glycomyces lechevalierae]
GARQVLSVKSGGDRQPAASSNAHSPTAASATQVRNASETSAVAAFIAAVSVGRRAPARAAYRLS